MSEEEFKKKFITAVLDLVEDRGRIINSEQLAEYAYTAAKNAGLLISGEK